MTALVQSLQVLSGIAWLLPAAFLAPRIAAAWRSGASRMTLLSVPVAFLAWLQVGFIVRWLAWPGTVAAMSEDETVTWASLYLLSSGCALWVFKSAWETRGE